MEETKERLSKDSRYTSKEDKIEIIINLLKIYLLKLKLMVYYDVDILLLLFSISFKILSFSFKQLNTQCTFCFIWQPKLLN